MQPLGSVTDWLVNDGAGVDSEEIFTVLANERRRLALRFLKQEETTVKIGAVAEQIAAWENEIDTAEVTGNDRKCVYTALLQSHLPKMDRAGVIEFNKSRGTISHTDATQNVNIYMNVVSGREIPWGKYYLGLSGVAITVLAAVWIGLWPFTLVPTSAWMMAIVAGFACSALAHCYSTEQIDIESVRDLPILR